MKSKSLAKWSIQRYLLKRQLQKFHYHCHGVISPAPVTLTDEAVHQSSEKLSDTLQGVIGSLRNVPYQNAFPLYHLILYYHSLHHAPASRQDIEEFEKSQITCDHVRKIGGNCLTQSLFVRKLLLDLSLPSTIVVFCNKLGPYHAAVTVKFVNAGTDDQLDDGHIILDPGLVFPSPVVLYDTFPAIINCHTGFHVFSQLPIPAPVFDAAQTVAPHIPGDLRATRGASVALTTTSHTSKKTNISISTMNEITPDQMRGIIYRMLRGDDYIITLPSVGPSTYIKLRLRSGNLALVLCKGAEETSVNMQFMQEPVESQKKQAEKEKEQAEEEKEQVQKFSRFMLAVQNVLSRQFPDLESDFIQQIFTHGVHALQWYRKRARKLH